MARRKTKLKKQSKKIVSVVMWLLGIIVAVGIGGAFINGLFLDVIILKWLPLLIHKIVGWTIVGFTIIGALMNLFK